MIRSNLALVLPYPLPFSLSSALPSLCIFNELFTIQYPSIKSLRSTIVERSFYGASIFAERRSRTMRAFSRNGVLTPFQFCSVFLLFRFHSVLLANQQDLCKVLVNASFGSEDDVQYASIKSLRSTIVERSFYSASVCISFLTKRCENGNGTERKRLINYA